jgi:hypothetical protein
MPPKIKTGDIINVRGSVEAVRREKNRLIQNSLRLHRATYTE